jgi:branched-chain amino acid transport system substrate-binding protein
MDLGLREHLILVAVLGGGLAACSRAADSHDPLGCVELDPGQSLTIGTAVPLTGPEWVSGETALAVIQKAATQKNTIDGNGIRVQKIDFNCTGTASTSASERLTGETILIGGIAPGCLLSQPAVQNAFNQAGIAVLTPSVLQLLPSANPGGVILTLDHADGANPSMRS